MSQRLPCPPNEVNKGPFQAPIQITLQNLSLIIPFKLPTKQAYKQNKKNKVGKYMIRASTWMKQIIQKAQIKTEEIRMLAISLQTHDNDSQNQLYQIDDCWEKTRSSMKQKKQQQSTQRRQLWAHHDSCLKELHGCKHHATQCNRTVGRRRGLIPNVSSTLNFRPLRHSFGGDCNFDRNEGLMLSGKCGHKYELESLTLYSPSRKADFCMITHWKMSLRKAIFCRPLRSKTLKKYIMKSLQSTSNI